MTIPVKRGKSARPGPGRTRARASGLLLACALLLALIYGQFRGDFTPKTKLTMLAAARRVGDGPRLESHLQRRAASVGWPASPRSSIAASRRPSSPSTSTRSTSTSSRSTSSPKIQATTVFGNKYVSLTSPKEPAPQRITPASRHRRDVDHDGVQHGVRDARRACRERRSGQGEPHAERRGAGVDGLGDKFGQSIVNGNKILDDLNPRMPRSATTSSGSRHSVMSTPRRTGSL